MNGLRKLLLACFAAIFVAGFQVNESIGQATVLISQGGTVPVNNGDLFYDAGGAAGNDGTTNYTITLSPAVAGQSVCLNFTMFNTYYDCSSEDADSVVIFDGTSTSATRIATLMGNYAARWSNANCGISQTPVGIGANSGGNGMAAVTTPGIFCSTNASGSLTISYYHTAGTTQEPGWAATIETYEALSPPGCNINLTANPNPVCSGSSVTLTATGSVIAAPINSNFNCGCLGTGWSGSPSVGFETNVCGQTSLDNSTFLWMENYSCPRTLTSAPMNVSTGGTVYFEYRQAAVNGDPSPCEAPDVNMSGSTPEAVFVQYSTNGGTTWTTMKVMLPSDMDCPTCDAYPGMGKEAKSWHKVIVPIPAAAQTASTQFRWIMPLCTSASTDNWGLDNVIISSPNTMTITLTDVTTGNTIIGTSTTSPYSVTVTPATTTTYEASITDGISTCTSQVVVTVNSCGCIPPTANAGTAGTISCTQNTSGLQIGAASVGGVTYAWSPATGLSNSTISNPIANPPTTTTYTVTATGSSSTCTATAQVVVTVDKNPPTASITNNTGTTVLTCTTTSINVTANGGGTYTWSGGSSTNTAANSFTAAGTYTVTVTAANGCTNTSNITITQNITPPTVNITNNTGTTVLTCSTTIINVTATGGGTYSWSGGSATNTAANSFTTPGTYTVTVTAADGCSNTSNITITQNITPPTVAITNNTGTTVLTCSTTAINVTATGGGTYSWSGGSATNTAANSFTTPGTYTVTVTAADGCTNTSNITITQNITPPTVAITNNTGTTVLTCSTTAINVTATGGTAYLWSGGNSTNTAANSFNTPGTYTVTATAADGCTNTSNIVITQSVTPPTVTITNNTGTTVLNCITTAINVTATGGGAYSWSGGSATNTAANSFNTPGTYTVTVTAADGCTNTSNIIITQNTTPPVSGITNNSGTTILTCTTTAINVTATGGGTYSWSGGSSTTIASNTFTMPGTYTVTVTAANGCTNTSDIIINQNITPPPAAITNNTGSTVFTCITTAISVTATGGGVYAWSGGSSANTAANSLTAGGTYIVTVTSANGCTDTSSITLTENNTPPVANAGTDTTITCASPSVQLNGSASSTGANFTYSWSGIILSGQNTLTPTVDQTGTYVLTVTDAANGCTASDQVVVSSNTPIPVANAGSDQIITCTSSSVTLNGSSSSTGANYIYSWTGTLVSGQGTLTPVVNQAGIYTLTVKDTTDGCSSMDNVIVTINTNPPTANAGPDKNITCASPLVQLDGSASSTGANLTYAWSGTIVSGSGTLTPTVNQTGTYTLTVTNITNGCTASDAVVVSNTNGPSFSSRDSVDASCNLSNGQATITVAGGTPPYSAVWNSMPQQNGLTLLDVPSGIYSVTVTDNGGCTITESIFIGKISPPTATISSTSELCNMGNGTVTVDASGGSGHYTYQWNTPMKDTTAVVTNLSNGNYTVTVNDGNCSIQLKVSVSNIPGPTASFTPNPDVLSTMDGPVTFFNNSTGNFNTWEWYFGDGDTSTTQTPMHSYPNAGTYIVSLVVRESNGCKDSVIDTVLVKNVLTLYIPNSFSPNGDDLNDWFFPKGENIDPSTYEFEIYDRWGNMVFYTNDINGKWNGTMNNKGTAPQDCVIGVYVYRIAARNINDGLLNNYFGSVTLIK